MISFKGAVFASLVLMKRSISTTICISPKQSGTDDGTDRYEHTSVFLEIMGINLWLYGWIGGDGVLEHIQCQ